jgi:hypothetical protein
MRACPVLAGLAKTISRASSALASTERRPVLALQNPTLIDHFIPASEQRPVRRIGYRADGVRPDRCAGAAMRIRLLTPSRWNEILLCVQPFAHANRDVESFFHETDPPVCDCEPGGHATRTVPLGKEIASAATTAAVSATATIISHCSYTARPMGVIRRLRVDRSIRRTP